MLYQIPSFLLDVIVGLLGGACLLRLYMQYHRVPFGNPLGRFIFAISDWIVLPLRRIVPSVKRWDLASLIAAWLLVMVKFLLLWLLIGNLGHIATLPLVSLVGLMQLAVSGLTALLVVYAVLSWIPNASPMLLDLISRLAEPLVRPFRRFIPLIGGVDLSPLAAIVVLQIECVGTQRFRIRTTELQKHGLWVAEVEAVPDDIALEIPDDLKHTATALRRLIDTLEERRHAQGESVRLPIEAPYRLDDCGWVANRWCELVPMQAELRQRMMALDSPLMRLELVSDLLARTGITE